MSDESDFVIHAYSLEQAVDDGVVVELWKEHWPTMSSGKPIVATAAIADTYDDDILKVLWSLYVTWRIYVMPKLPEEDQMFVTQVGSKTVWILEDGASFCVMYPDDY
jgi:hypothetical protein